MPSGFLFNLTGTKVTGSYSRGATGDWAESNSNSVYTFRCALQPMSASESDFQLYAKETSSALYKLYWEGFDTNGAAVTFNVQDKVIISALTYQIVGVSMNMAGRARIYKAIVERLT